MRLLENRLNITGWFNRTAGKCVVVERSAKFNGAVNGTAGKCQAARQPLNLTGRLTGPLGKSRPISRLPCTTRMVACK